MADRAQKIEMAHIDESGNTVKTVSKKLLPTMTVTALKAMIAKLFKVEVLE